MSGETADNVASNPALGCTAGSPWACSDSIVRTNFVQGTLAGRSLLVEPALLYVHATGSTSDPANWTSIDFGLGAGVSLAAAAGNSTEWYVLANDTNTGRVKIFRFAF